MSDSTPSVSTQEFVDYLDLVREMLEECAPARAEYDRERISDRGLVLSDEVDRCTIALKRRLRAQVGK